MQQRVPRSEAVHRVIRAITKHYRPRFAAAWVNRRLDRFFDSHEPNWLVAPAHGHCPTMVFNVASNLQRKLFYFPKVYGKFYLEAPFGKFLEQELPAGSGFIEIGSNVGFFTLLAARLVGPTGRVYAFEPEPNIHESLVRSAAANRYHHVKPFNLALSDRDEEVTLYRATDGTANSLLPEAPGRERRYENAIRVRATMLDKLLSERRLAVNEVRVIKLDVEGAEARTVAGMRETLRAASYPKIWCEVRGPKGSTRAPNTFPAVAQQLAPLGYRPFQWQGGQVSPLADAAVQGREDVLFMRA